MALTLRHVTLFFNEHWHGSRINVKHLCKSVVRSYQLQSDVNNWPSLPENLGASVRLWLIFAYAAGQCADPGHMHLNE
jgi:hypothetical protein